jgi:hypothetical protein
VARGWRKMRKRSRFGIQVAAMTRRDQNKVWYERIPKEQGRQELSMNFFFFLQAL